MAQYAWNSSWEVRSKGNVFNEMMGRASAYKTVRLPHDFMIEQDRDAQAPSGAASAYYPDVTVEYRKTWNVPEEWASKSVTLVFEGVYRNARVHVNNAFVAERPYGYSEFQVSLDSFLRYGQENTLKVYALAGDDSRWYSGAGIYRPVQLYVDPLVHARAHSERVSTLEVSEDVAVLEFCAEIVNATRAFQYKRVETQILDQEGHVVAELSSPVSIPGTQSVQLRQRLYVKNPSLWSPDTPQMYTLQYCIRDEDGSIGEQDEEPTCVPFGIRTLQLSPLTGLRINGQQVKLRGACIHHDNGILGAATFAAAEYRRIRQLKDAGFNAIRSSHQPVSRAMLDACDRLGMLVMDEAFDMWMSTKTEHDYALNMAQWWQRDIESMVEKDYNHPSVILYSIGNEIPEVGTHDGAVWGRAMAQKVRELDSTRYVTNAMNTLVTVMVNAQRPSASSRSSSGSNGEAQDKGVNGAMAALDQMLGAIATAESTSLMTEESADILDVTGFNYAIQRYELDKTRFPNRVLVGSETYPAQIDELWEAVERYDHVIGDFTWTGYDYLGEAGIGRIQYVDDAIASRGIASDYPWRYAYCADLDITGQRRPVSYYREIVYGLRREPYVSVLPPERFGVESHGTPWSWRDGISSWTWRGQEGKTTRVDVYSDAPDVELVLNGRSLGVRSVGEEKKYLVSWEMPYEPGTLEAYAIRDGHRAEKYVLETAGEPAALALDVTQQTLDAKDDDALSFIELTVRDAQGRVVTDTDVDVHVSVDGPAELYALGSAHPARAERYDAGHCLTYQGRALAAVRPASGASGEVTVTASAAAPAVSQDAAGIESARAVLHVE